MARIGIPRTLRPGFDDRVLHFIGHDYDICSSSQRRAVGRPLQVSQSGKKAKKALTGVLPVSAFPYWVVASSPLGSRDLQRRVTLAGSSYAATPEGITQGTRRVPVIVHVEEPADPPILLPPPW